MLLDWKNPPYLPRRQRLDPLDRNRLGKAKPKRKHPKRHSENRERSILEQRLAAERKVATAEFVSRVLTFKRLVAAYWRGEIENFPPKPNP